MRRVRLARPTQRRGASYRLQGCWRASKEPREETTTVDVREERRAWLIRGANVDGHNLIPAWLSEGYCSIGWARVGPVEAGTTRRALAARVDESRPDESPGAKRNDVGNLYRFHNEINIGDLVVTIDGSKVYVGVVTSEPTWVETDPHGPRRRAVEWTNPNHY